MPEDLEVTKRVEDIASKHGVDIKAVRTYGDTLFVEADYNVNELSYLAALWFHTLSDYEFDEVAVRHSRTNETEEYGLYEVLGRLITAADND